MKEQTEKLQADHQVLGAYLAQRVKTNSSLRPLETVPDKINGFICAFDLTPCCYPLHCLAWIDAKLNVCPVLVRAHHASLQTVLHAVFGSQANLHDHT